MAAIMTKKRLAAIAEAVTEYTATHDQLAAELHAEQRFADAHENSAKSRAARTGLRIIMARFPMQASQLEGSME